MNTVTAAIQGSGWGWLGYNPETKKLEIVTTANQDPLLSHVPIIGIDIWEHAFYLQYHNVKADYLTAIWNVINFKEAERRFLEAAKSA
ncbi:Manganese/iron superoxide dismutase [Cerioporus squamosus]|nr:Manganese/iron superoxide dismutase [Cerioporus squamosus]